MSSEIIAALLGLGGLALGWMLLRIESLGRAIARQEVQLEEIGRRFAHVEAKL